MSTSERDRVHNIMQNRARGNDIGQKLTWDPLTKQIRAVDQMNPNHSTLEVTPSDMEHFAD